MSAHPSTQDTPRFSGLIPPVLTPMNADGTVDEASFRNVIDFQLEAGATGVFALGSSGEAIYLDDRTRRQVAEIARDAVGDRAQLLLGALAPTIDRVAQQITLLAGLGDAVVVNPPFYAAPSPNEILAHFRQAAAATDRPLLAYDIPGNVGYSLSPEVVAELMSEGTIAALKASAGDIEQLDRVVELLGTPRRGALLSGADTTVLQALDSGADGLIPGLANVRPDLFAELLQAHRAGDRARATVLQHAITELNGLFRVGQRYGLGRHASEIGGLKLVLRERGIIATTRLARPLEDYPAPAEADARALIASIDRYLAEHPAGAPDAAGRP